MLAVFAFGAVMASAASAEETLLAEWLVNGLTISTLLPIFIEGTLLLEDTETIAGKSSVSCTGITDGSAGPNGESEITEVLNLKGEKISELGGLALLGTGPGTDCITNTGCSEGTTASPIEVHPLGLPWLYELFLMVTTNEILALITSMAAGKLLGYEILCLILGLNAEDTCTAADLESPISNELPEGDAEVPANALLTPNANCTQSGGKATGVNESVELAFVRPQAPATELLTVSSEGFGH